MQVQGLTKVMVDEVATRLNFTYQLQDITPDGSWGEMVNGTWMGMIGQVVRGEKDLIINSFAILHDRYQAISFSDPYFTDAYSASLRVKLLPKVPHHFQIKWPCVLVQMWWCRCIVIQVFHYSCLLLYPAGCLWSTLSNLWCGWLSRVQSSPSPSSSTSLSVTTHTLSTPTVSHTNSKLNCQSHTPP